jgi:hypothetical protein
MTRTGRQHATSGTLRRASDGICGVAARILVAQDASSQAPGRLPSSRLTATRARPDLQWEAWVGALAARPFS